MRQNVHTKHIDISNRGQVISFVSELFITFKTLNWPSQTLSGVWFAYFRIKSNLRMQSLYCFIFVWDPMGLCGIQAVVDSEFK